MKELQRAPGHQRLVVKAELKWLSLEQGGRKAPPTVQFYRSIPRFAEDPNWKRGVWDLTVEFLEYPNVENPSRVWISFDSNGAPEEFLHSGSRFELTEGRKVVALGQVLGRKLTR
jgi:hypothetical protein